MTQPRLTLCTGTRHRPESLQRWINSAVAAATVPCEIIIADASDNPDWMASGDRVKKHESAAGPIMVARYHESPRLLPNRGYDKLVRTATTEFVTFFNDDAECVPGWDKIALDFMDEHPEIGIGCLFWNDPGGTPYLQSFRGIAYANFGIVRKSAADVSGWFDLREAFIPQLGRNVGLSFYGNDVGISFKMIDAGFAVVGIPGSFVRHHREQDDERRQNNARFVHCPEGQIAGEILHQLWGGIAGIVKLREKAARFDYLSKPIDRNGNVVDCG